MTFYCKYGGIETQQPWKRPQDDIIREWRDELSFSLDDWYVVGNVVEKFSSTWDVDIFLIQEPLKLSLNDLSNQFTEMITKGFEKELLIDCAYMNKFYQDEWEPVSKIRPDKEFVKHWNGGIYHDIYKADEVKQLHPQLWEYKYTKPHNNWFKGKNRGYSFTGIKLDKF
jgi:hypothetical protein